MKYNGKTFAVIGLGRFGTSITEALNDAGADVVAVDVNQDKVNEIESFCTQAICADAANDAVLDRLGIRNFDVVIVSIGNDIEASIFITLACKLAGVQRVIAKAQNLRHKMVLEKIGADLVIIPEEEYGKKLAATLTNPKMIEIMELAPDFRMIEIKTPSKWRNKSLQQLDLRRTERVNILLVKRSGEVIATPDADFVLRANDNLIISGSLADTARLSSKATADVVEDFLS